MNYVTHMNILGIDIKQIACITLNSAPNKYTEGAFGCLAMDKDGNLYKCIGESVDITGKTYNWVSVESDSSSQEIEKLVINRNTRFEFPSIGSPNVIYKAEKEAQLYQWNSEKLCYEKIDVGDTINVDFEIIYGGNANG